MLRSFYSPVESPIYQLDGRLDGPQSKSGIEVTYSGHPARTLVSILPELYSILEGTRLIEEILPFKNCWHGNDHYDPQLEFWPRLTLHCFVAIRGSNVSADGNKTKRSTQGVSGGLSQQPDGLLSYCYSLESTCLGNRWGEGMQTVIFLRRPDWSTVTRQCLPIIGL